MKANDDVISIRYVDFVKSLKPPSSKGCDHYDEDTKDVISIWPTLREKYPYSEFFSDWIFTRKTPNTDTFYAEQA